MPMRLFFTQLFVSERKQIAIMAEEKSHARIFLRLFATSRSEMRIGMGKYEKEKSEVIDWLAHPNELGSEPYKIEYVKEFTDEEEFKCLIFKYKKSPISPWLLAISSDAGVFSEMLKYNEETAIEDAKKLMNYLKDYWKSIARAEDEKEEREANADGFMGFALLENAEWNYEEFEEIFAKDWGIVLVEENENVGAADTQNIDNDVVQNADIFKDEITNENNKENVDTKIYAVGPMRLIISYMGFCIPEGEAEYNAQFNYMWKEAVDTTKKHKAHVLVTVVSDTGIKERGILFAKAIASSCKMNNVIGIYENEVVYEPDFLIRASEMIKDGTIPLFNLIWFGISSNENGISVYTCGMSSFGRDEMEIIDSKKKPSELRDILINLAGYVINEDIILYDGDTLGLRPGEKAKFKMSEGVNVRGYSLKVDITK